MPSVSSQRTAPDAYKHLVWDVFFASRGRGTSLAAHFPWLQGQSPSTWYVTLSADDRVVGGLAVRDVNLGSAEQDVRVASMGLVCIDPSFRGQGWSQILVNCAVSEAKSFDLDALLLWTGKPQVYRRLGFEVADPALYGWINRPVQREPQQGTAYRQPWPSLTEGEPQKRGLPPFALEGHQWFSRTSDATLTTLEDSAGTILAEWGGAPKEVAKLMEDTLPPRFRMNALQGDSVLGELAARGWKSSLVSSHLQMILPIRGHRNTRDWSERVRVRILDRM